MARGDIAAHGRGAPAPADRARQRGADPGRGARRARAVLVGHGRRPDARAPREDRAAMTALDHHREPTTPATISSAASSRCMRRRRRLPTTSSSSTTPRPTAALEARPAALAGRPRHRARAQPAASPPATTSGIRATRGELLLLLNSDTVVPAGAIDTLVARLRAHPDAAVAGPRLIDAAGRVELSFGPMISPLAELRQKATVAMHTARHPAGGAVGRAGDAARAVRGLGQRRVPARLARGCRGGRAARRAVLSLHRGRRLLRRAPRARPAGFSSRPPPRSSTCAAGPGPAPRAP